ncbi:MAG: hypothetical protein J5850_04250 [Clostridia bacterium]|nr:hypothetical protein [Clostridia bacterium]
MKQKLYICRFLAAVLLITMLISLISCNKKKGNGMISGSDESVTTTDVSEENKKPVYDTPYICSTLRSLGNPISSLPDGSAPDGREIYSFENITLNDYNEYLSKLEGEGFTVTKTKYGAFLFRDDCMMSFSYQSNVLHFMWFQKSEYAPENGLTSSDVAERMYPEKSMSDAVFYPIDITPEGFFDRTGGQIFAVPKYSYDEYAAQGSEELILEDNEHYSLYAYYINGEVCIPLDYFKIASFDIDKDGDEEILALERGYTSGLFSFGLAVISDGIVYDVSSVQLQYYSEMNFVFADGVLKLHLNDPAGGIEHWLDIVKETIGEETYFFFYENGKRVNNYWGG